MISRKKAFRRLILAVLLTAVLSPWAAEIIRCELLTRQHGSEMLEVVKSEFEPNPVSVKVLDYSRYEKWARVYCVSEGREIRSVLLFARSEANPDDWTLLEWDTRWSRTGSASEAAWPYWPFYF